MGPSGRVPATDIDVSWTKPAETRQPDKSLACFQRAVEISKANGAHRIRAVTLNNMGNLLKDQTRYDEAIAALTEALRRAANRPAR